jgi:signal transduction histidine kinase
MSLKSRLRIAILGLVVGIVLALSLLNLQSSVEETFSDAIERAELTAQQVKTFVIERIPEQVALRSQGPQLPEDTRNIWYEVVRTDKIIPRILERSMTNSAFVIEIAITDNQGRILAGSTPELAGSNLGVQRSLADWRHRGFWFRLHDVLNTSHDYLITKPVGFSQQTTPVLTINVLVSSVLLRQELVPQLRQLCILSGISLLLSAFLAVLVSNLVARSFEQLSTDIDRIAKGDLTRTDPEFLSPEMADVQAKLAVLGQDYHGIRQDAIALKQSVDQMLQRLEEAVFVFDAHGRLELAGKPAERLLARPLSQLLGRPFDEIFPAWTGVGGTLQEALRKRTPLVDQPVTLERANMPTAKLLLTVEFGRAPGRRDTLLTLRDAESRRQLESQLSVSQRLAAISKLTSGLAHEIKNPLNAVGLHLEICRSKIAAGQNVDRELHTIAHELTRVDRVVKTFLEFAKPIEPRMERRNLDELVREAVEIARLDGNARGVRIDLDRGAPEAWVMADPELARQAILHILRNAVEAFEKGGTIQVQITEKFEDYAIAVTDDGPGIRPELYDKIFNLYFTTKPNGSGIGLAVTFLILQLHNGTLEFDSEVGKGTTFRLRFPRPGNVGVVPPPDAAVTEARIQ